MDNLIIKILRGLRESGINQMPAELKEIVYRGGFPGSDKAIVKFNEKFGKCAICGFREALDWHHLMVVDHTKPLMMDGREYEYCLGTIRLCPNHHALVHRNHRGTITKL